MIQRYGFVDSAAFRCNNGNWCEDKDVKELETKLRQIKRWVDATGPGPSTLIDNVKGNYFELKKLVD